MPKRRSEFSLTNQSNHELCLEMTDSVPQAAFSCAHVEIPHHTGLLCNPPRMDIAPQEPGQLPSCLVAYAGGVTDVTLHG